ncbi:MAG: amino acid permease, partial [Candidatus Marinimicrobia bacterium]|nr:amino acid permease [Candidatus Neomarinimicrobiota bacterium]
MTTIKRELSLSHVLAIIIGTVIGSGVFISLPIVQKATGSPLLASIAWLVGGLIWLPQIFILSEMGTAYPKQGFGYLYLQKAGSPMLAFLYVWTVFWTSDTPSITILAVSAIAALKIFAPVLADSVWTKLLAALLIAILTWVHYRSVRQGGRLQIVLT